MKKIDKTPFLTDDIIVNSRLPWDSFVRKIKRLRTDVVVIRPWTPASAEGAILHVVKNEKWPKVHGTILAITRHGLVSRPDMKVGVQVFFSRFSDEQYGEDNPIDVEYVGPKLPVCLISIDEICLVVEPSLIPLAL